MTLEALRTKLDSLVWENSQLEIENRRLRESNRDQAAMVDLEAELERSKEDTVHLTEQLGCLEQKLSAALQREDDLRQRVEAAEGQPKTMQPEEQIVQELETAKRDVHMARSRAAESEDQAKKLAESLARETARVRELESELDHQREIAIRLEQDAELQRYRMLEGETRKWEAREERLVEQLARMREELRVAKVERGEDHVAQRGVDSSAGDAVQREVRFEAHSESSSVTVEQGSPVPQQDQSAGAITDRLSQALLAQQLPTIPKFTGEERQQGGETIEDWKEQFEMVATLGGWDERSKLVNLVTRLRGQAYSFYRSCTMQQRSSYATMMEELVKRFTPVRLQAVHSSQFHERKQKPQESVDDYAQDLRRLFHKAYPTAQRGSRETEEMGQSVLSNQFVSGLKPELKTKVAGMEGNFEQLLVKARFEEAKRRDIMRPSFPKPPFQNRYRGQFKSGNDAKPEESVTKPSGTQRQGQSDIKCYACGAFGHISRNCPRNC